MRCTSRTDRAFPWPCPSPWRAGHNVLFDIEVQFEGVTATPQGADIPVEGLFMNADAGFDSREFREICAQKEINANICSDKRTGSKDRDGYFDKELYDQ